MHLFVCLIECLNSCAWWYVSTIPYTPCERTYITIETNCLFIRMSTCLSYYGTLYLSASGHPLFTNGAFLCVVLFLVSFFRGGLLCVKCFSKNPTQTHFCSIVTDPASLNVMVVHLIRRVTDIFTTLSICLHSVIHVIAHVYWQTLDRNHYFNNNQEPFPLVVFTTLKRVVNDLCHEGLA